MIKKNLVFGALTNRWWSDRGGRTWKEFFPSSALLNYSEKLKNSKKKFKFFFMLLPAFGTLVNPHLWS
jgi:hypothetical protein